MTPAGDPWASVPGPKDPSDHQDVSFCDLAKANRELDRVTDEIMGMTDEVADARTVEKFNSERLANALAKGQVKNAGVCKSVAQSETVARVDNVYLAEVDQLEADYKVAQRSIMRHKNLIVKAEALRTKISAQKEAMGLR